MNLDDSQPAAHAFTGPREGDAFGQLLLRAHTTDGPVCEVMERDDGLISTGDARRYLSTLDGDVCALDRQMLALARGRVLDVGCGAGRHALHLQAAGLDVTGLELSPGAVQVAGARGVHVIQGSIFDPPEVGRFDTIVLVGNNLSLLGSPQQAPQLLHVLSRLANPQAIIIAEGLDPYHAAEADHVAYHQRNRAAGRAGGQVRMRVRDGAVATGWMQLWQLSPAELQQVLHGGGWQIRQLRLRDSGPGYFAELNQAPQ